MFKLNKTAACVAAALFAVGAGSAQAARIDPFGLGGAGGSYEVANLGWNNGNAISAPLGATDLTDPVEGDRIQTYGHAKLQGLSDRDGNTLLIAGFNPNNWTYVFGFSEEVVDSTATANTFRTTSVDADGLPLGTPNFFQVWANGKTATDLSGKGFNGDGGAVLLISGKIADYDPTTGIGQTSFDASAGFDPSGALDQFVADDYAGYLSVKGTGGGKINAVIDSVNDKYFLDGLSLLTLDLITDTFQNLPFLQVNPSSCFWDGSAYFSGAGNGIVDGCGALGDFGTIGVVNGGADPVFSGPNVMFQTRATTVLPTIPEPGTLALLGLGALGMFVRRRKL